MRRPLLLVLLVVAGLSGCGRGSPDVSDTAARSLEPKIADVRAAAEARQPDIVKAKLAELRAEVATLREQGELSEVGALRVLAAVGGIEQHLALITTATTEPRPPTPSSKKDHDEKEGKEDEEGGEKRKERDEDD